MPKVVTPLTDAQVKNAKPKPKSSPKQYRLADGKGLYLQVSPRGEKIWLYNFQTPFTKERTNISLGKYEHVTLEKARKKAAKYRKLLAKNIDPRDYRRERKLKALRAKQNTLEAVVNAWIEIEKSKISENYANDVFKSLQNHVLPKLGHRPISEITAPETKDVLTPLANQGKLEMVKRLCQRLNSVMDYAINVGIIEKGSNPLTGLRKAFAKPKTVNNPTIKPEELPELFRAIERAEIRLVTRRLFEFQLHTATRPSEAAGAAWSEFDLKKKLWTLPKSRMKADKEHVVPLTSQVIEILEERKESSGHLEYVFPSIINPRQHIHQESINKMLRRNGYQGRLTGHGLRAVFSTAMNEKGCNPDLVEVALAHIGKDKTRQSYNHATYIPQRLEMMQLWSNIITAAKHGETLEGKKHLSIAS